MTIPAFPETYRSKAQSTLGAAFDYAVEVLNVPGEEFTKRFVASSVAKRWEKGDPAIVAGKSGIEIAIEVLKESGFILKDFPQKESFGRSVAHWIGWVVAYYQWRSDRSFQEIFAALSYEDLERLYHPLHEADISKAYDMIEELIEEKNPDTNLKRLRTRRGVSQAELAKEAGIGLRSIQMYEQRQKQINKASAETLYRLSKVLGCSVEDLLEKA
ncbi:MAG: helix-turn-helix transcriptional regulator [Bacilli bacterium]|nr:helix-turn-helix transcriptional regulator [Bacilli bacterium]